MKENEVRFVEQLLKAYKGMKAERLNLNNTWNILERQKNNAIEGQYLSAMTLSDMPGTPRGSYKESPTLLVKNTEDVNDIRQRQSFIVERLKDLDDIITVVDNSLNSLSNQDKDIVCFYYVDRYSLEKIGQIVYLHPQKVYEHKKYSISYLYKSLKALEGTVIFKRCG